MEGTIDSAKRGSESPSLSLWFAQKINRAQGDILDLVEIACMGRVERIPLDILRSRIKRILQDLSREAQAEMEFSVPLNRMEINQG